MKYLKDILEKEIDVYNNYLEAAIKKKQALIDNDIDLLEDITVTEKDLSTKILALEAARIEFLREEGYSSNIHLNDLLEEVPSEDKDSLEATAQNLRDVLAECKKFHDSNMNLLKQSSNYLNHMIKIFTQSINGGKGSPTYGKTSQKFESGKIADLQG
jgi:flagellar biosynthesis/type III secretory pathway chaperone